MLTPWGQLPPLPEIGHPESYYAKQVKRAEQLDNPHAREAYKVGQYITLALDPALAWEKKLRYFRHAIRAHCVAPPVARDTVWMFYAQLADLVRQHAGTEALRLACEEDEMWANRTKFGEPVEKVRAEAHVFFRNLLGDTDHQPDFLNQEDWDQLQLLKKQWI
jgi:hypothetical protein